MGLGGWEEVLAKTQGRKGKTFKAFGKYGFFLAARRLLEKCLYMGR